MSDALDISNVQNTKTARAGGCADEITDWVILSNPGDPLREKNVVDQFGSGLKWIYPTRKFTKIQIGFESPEWCRGKDGPFELR